MRHGKVVRALWKEAVTDNSITVAVHLVDFDGVNRGPRTLEGVNIDDSRLWEGPRSDMVQGQGRVVVEVAFDIVDAEAVGLRDMAAVCVHISYEAPVPVGVHNLHDLTSLDAQFVHE